MTRPKESMSKEKHIVLAFDICSSTDILEDLLRTENIKEWRDFLIWIKNYLIKKSKSEEFDIYKFTGDGWILLFGYDYSGMRLLDFLEEFSKKFQVQLNKKILSILETKPEVTGLTFGLDRSTLVKIIMNGRKEYIGRAINVACRLQGAIKDKDSAPQYKLLMTNPLYKDLKVDLSNYKCVTAKRTLRNIAGGKVLMCKKITLRMAISRRHR